MIDKDSIDTVASATNAVGEIIKAAGDSQEAKQAGSNIGKAAVTITAAINNCLLPIAAVNYGFEKARFYFNNFFQTDIKAATADIPEEDLIEPKPSIAAPALQALAFAHEEPDLKDLYLKLLACAMDSRNSSKAHPAFVEIIRQLTALEAQALKTVLLHAQTPMAQINMEAPRRGKFMLHNHLMNWRDPQTGVPKIDPELPVMVDNWVRLGLVEVSYEKWLNNDVSYAWVDERPEVTSSKPQILIEGFSLKIQRGLMTPTAFGNKFAQATGMSLA